MKKLVVVAGLMAVAFGGVVNSDACAQGLAGGGFKGRVGGGPFVGGFGGTSFSTVWDLYLRGNIPVPPYFALHPPVYYSYPVPRPYGYSPFAYPPTVKTPEVLASAPTTIHNPYVPSSVKQGAEESDRVTKHIAPRPLIIENPYVEQTTQYASLER